ncbi:LOW QUALITY PROTEIN: class I histocompatibility antigen, F10 alpha chain-like [Discoglossus pictus]
MQIARYISETRGVQLFYKSMEDYTKHWEMQTMIGQYYEDEHKNNVYLIQQLFNRTQDVYTYQVKFACELYEDGSIGGYEEFGVNGKEFIVFDKEKVVHVPMTKEAQLITQRWYGAQREKLYMEQDCIEWIKKYLKYVNEDLERKVTPKVKVSSHQSDKVTRLHCRLYGVYPRAVDVKWVKNGVDDNSEEDKQILPNPDGTFQIISTVDVTPEEGASYSCHVNHSSLKETLIVLWEPDNSYSHYNVIVATTAAVIIITIVLGIYVYMRKSRNAKTRAQVYLTELEKQVIKENSINDNQMGYVQNKTIFLVNKKRPALSSI